MPEKRKTGGKRMRKNAAENVEPVSRLALVREGNAEAGGTPNIPRRGRILVDIESITPDPANERKAFRGLEQLAETIKQIGLIESPTVIALEDGRYMLTTGERRWRAAKLAGLKRINVIARDRKSVV